MKYLSLITILVLLTMDAMEQTPPPPPPNLLPTLTSPSPEVAAFAKYGNYEVNLFNGTPDISIPLYSVRVGDLSVPITLRYDASGVKVAEVPSNVGTGWSLSAGGAITRKVMGGIPDEYSVSVANAGFFGYLNGGTVKDMSSIDVGSASTLEYMREVSDRHRIDPEPDVFSYSVPGKSGKFVYSQPDGLKPFMIPYQPVVIRKTITGGTSMNMGMTDESGINYEFNTQESSLNSGQILNIPYTSSWLLTKMSSANNQDSIVFRYSAAPTLTQTFSNDNITVIDGISQSPDILTPVYTPNPSIPPTTLYTYSSIFQQNLDSIVFRNGKVVFQQAPEARLDLSLTGLKKRIQKILVYSLTGSTYKLIKEIDLYHSYFIRYASYGSSTDSAATRRLRLDSLLIKDAAGTNIQRYVFGYNNRTDNYGLPGQNAKCIDYWGYYNGKFATSLVPRTDIPYTAHVIDMTQTVQIGANFYGSRDPDSAFMQADVLNKITFPAGGYTTFTYETNQYSPTNLPANAKLAGGLRIKRIQSYDGPSTPPVTKTYIYGQNESGFGTQNFVLDNYFFYTQQSKRYAYQPTGTLSYVVGATENIRTYMANPSVGLEPYDAAPVAYIYVTEYEGDPVSNNGKTVYQFNNTPDVVNYHYSIGAVNISTKHYHRGQVLFKNVYRRNPDNTYTMVQQTENQYGAYPDSTRYLAGMTVTHFLHTDGTYASGQQIDENLPAANDASGLPLNGTVEYSIYNYDVQSGDGRLIKTIHRTYDQINPSVVAVQTTNYLYGNFKHMQPTRVTTTNSKGETIVDTLLYPHEVAAAGNVYQSMVNANIIDKQIQDKKTNNGTQTDLKKTNYADWGNSNYLPQSVQLQVGANAIENRASFLSYDQLGNVTQMQKTNDIVLSYLWDYKGIYVIAEVKNATTADIAYTSFEAEAKGNWTYTGATTADATTPTGGVCYSLSGGALSKSGLTSTNTYVVSYWIKGSTPLTITGTQSGYPLTGKTIKGWTYFEHKVTGVSSVSISGTAYVDEIRLHPWKAQMTSYTYTPLIGITSICDTDGKLTYYTYDNFGRLKWIRDQDGNIVKAYQYHYQAMPASN